MSSTPHLPCAILALPPCKLAVFANEHEIEQLVFLAPDTPPLAPNTAMGQRIAQALQAYLATPALPATLPFARHGTAFQQRVWQAIAAIPAGEVRRYGDIAAELGSAARAVGQACGANPFPIFVPCHRVVAAQGLGGFAHHGEGWLTATKRWLLAHEGIAR